MKAANTKCKHIGPDGTACRATLMRGDRFCFFHSPQTAERRASARQLGGKRSRPVVLLPDIQAPRSAEDFARIMGDVLADVLSGKLAVGMATKLAFVANSGIKALHIAALMKSLRQRGLDRADGDLDKLVHEWDAEKLDETDSPVPPSLADKEADQQFNVVKPEPLVPPPPPRELTPIELHGAYMRRQILSE